MQPKEHDHAVIDSTERETDKMPNKEFKEMVM